jgi:phenylpyruvate tautomerase PptA (4-oxalocrotonate tautomerase family)
MPILTVEIVARESEEIAPNLAGAIADAAGEIFGSAPGRTWVRLHVLPAAHYAENGTPSDATPEPVFVTVLKAEPPIGVVLADEAAQLVSAIGALCGRPSETVHVFYEPPAAGRVAFGGKPVV